MVRGIRRGEMGKLKLLGGRRMRKTEEPVENDVLGAQTGIVFVAERGSPKTQKNWSIGTIEDRV